MLYLRSNTTLRPRLHQNLMKNPKATATAMPPTKTAVPPAKEPIPLSRPGDDACTG